MSIFSGRSRTSNASSILKRTPNIKSTLKERTPIKVRFELPHTKKIKKILKDFATNTNTKEYESLICRIRDSELLEEDIRQLLRETTRCISLLNKNQRLFVEAILRLKWITYSKEVVTDYQAFLANLLSAHNYHAKIVIDSLVSNFITNAETNDWPNGAPTEEDCIMYMNVHFALNTILSTVPMCIELLVQSLTTNYPYFKLPSHVHEVYIQNLLWILNYRPQLRVAVLTLIFSGLVELDVNSPKEEIERAEYDVEEDVFDLDESTTTDKMKHPQAHTLDVCLDRIFNYIIAECHDTQNELDWDKTKRLHQDLIQIFDAVLLPTYKIHHVQFVMFLFCSFKSTVTEAFLNHLWKKVVSPSVAAVHRHTAAMYIGSLIARGSFIPKEMLKGTLQQMADWIHSYISYQEGLKCDLSDVRRHTVFYSVCQALFYVIAFRYKDFVSKRKNVAFLESLNLAKMVTCSLNPLRVCHQAVVQNFASITRTYQLVYCYTVIEHNARNQMPTIYQDDKGSVLLSTNVLDSFFPFDPFILRRSSKKIDAHYAEYQGVHDSFDTECDGMEMDDFLTYGASPGFKHSM